MEDISVERKLLLQIRREISILRNMRCADELTAKLLLNVDHLAEVVQLLAVKLDK